MSSSDPQFHAEHEAQRLNEETVDIIDEVRNLKAQGITDANLQETKEKFQQLIEQNEELAKERKEITEELKQNLVILLNLKVLFGDINLTTKLLNNTEDKIIEKLPN